MARPFVLSHKASKEHVEIYRKAFMSTLADPEFMAEADKMQEEVKYTSGEKIAELAVGILKTEPATMERFRKAVEAE